ncbi:MULTISPECIES: HD-GYP domain-containing protein [unclassified Paenibacillus]|uniref:HD-GYP domain-containing protein n=1 Tax=unclassified Paenibacillus TaxID=185978 RepID=UPI0004F711E8|nr:HD domain-containing phosphohydrolase [Paenibacillus sp. FSL R5-0345]AIQ35219.1 HD family phosphohydrolase [Paenibacillus sp. FSL R5-0345]
MKAHVTDLKHGDCLMMDTFNSVGLHVLPKGTIVYKEEITLLMRHRIDYVDIEPRSIAMDNEGMNLEQSLNGNFDLVIQNYESIFLEALSKGSFTQSDVDLTLQPLLEKMDEHKDVVSLLLLLEREDVGTYNHSLQVGLLSFYIATWLGYTKEERYEISRAGYLHDIGKSQIDPSILNKAGNLTSEETEELKRHTTYGYDIILKSMNDEKTALVALQHHEFEDGTGYPNMLRKTDLHPYTLIVAVANAYVGMTSTRANQPKQGLITVLRKVHELGFGKLNGNAVQALIGHLLPNFVGKNVQLSNGEQGTIIMNNPLDIFKPLVKVDETTFRDLSKERNLTVEEVFI